MTEFQSPEAARILERLRHEIAYYESQVAPPEEESVPANAEEPPVDGLAPLRAEVETALAGHRDVGQINPRGPGLHNRIIQFVKKLMRRSLTWYTRPIHVFQGAVIRALQQTVSLLQKQQELSGRLSQELSSIADQVADTRQQFDCNITERLARSSTELSSQIARSRTDLLGHVSRINDHLSSEIVRNKEQLLGQMDAIRSSTAQLEQLRGVVDLFHEELRNGRAQLLAVIRQQRARERDVRRFVNAVETGAVPLSSDPAIPTPPMFASEIKRQDEFDYFLFEENYRGDESVIRSRQAEYLQYFKGRENVVDIGCGRGEFLELLRDNVITARGVELGFDQFLLCREKGLDVVQQDLFNFLESLPDESLGGLFSAQVIEHLTASDQLRYVALAYRKCKPGSPVIFETINAQCVFAVVRNFFLDPTHVRPVHPETLKFAMESVNFRDVELKFMAPVVEKHIPALNAGGNPEEIERFNVAIRQLNDLIYGCQDYAAVGWR